MLLLPLSLQLPLPSPWSSPPSVEQQVSVGTDGRPLSADIEVWDGPGNTPVSMRVYGEDGQQRPVRAVIGGRGTPNTVAVRNTGPMEFPMTASVVRPCWRVRFWHRAAALERERMSFVCEHLRTDAFAHTGKRILKLMWRLR